MLPIGLPNGPYSDGHGIPLLATDAVSGGEGLCAAAAPHRTAGTGRSNAAAAGGLAAPCPPADMEKKGLRDQLEAQAREIQRLQGEWEGAGCAPLWLRLLLPLRPSLAAGLCMWCHSHWTPPCHGELGSLVQCAAASAAPLRLQGCRRGAARLHPSLGSPAPPGPALGCTTPPLPHPLSAPPAGTLAHYRNWAAQLQARYQLFNPDAARPAKRV